jgi:hypothetical protein
MVSSIALSGQWSGDAILSEKWKVKQGMRFEVWGLRKSSGK